MKKEEYVGIWDFSFMANDKRKSFNCERFEIIKLTPNEAKEHLEANRLGLLRTLKTPYRVINFNPAYRPEYQIKTKKRFIKIN